MHTLRLCSLVAAAMLLASSAAHARKLTQSDILGTWCGNEAKYVFTREALTVTWYGKADRRVLPINSWDFSDTWINVIWSPGHNTVFGEFSTDDRSMAQLANTKGDMGPRRPFHRCK